MPPQVTVFIAKHQALIALGCLFALALELLGVYSLPPAVNMAIAAVAGSLGVARPSEAAAHIAGEVSSAGLARGSFSFAAVIAALASSFAVVQPEQPPSPDAQGVEKAAEHRDEPIPTSPASDLGTPDATSSGGSSSS